ncbi:MAG: DUF2786 domain-containing protein [Candidatus Methanomethylophilaceae archaeon]
MTDIEAIKRKICRCLALSGSPEENEARTALKMARKLMSIYKIEEKDLEKIPTMVETKESSITYSTRRDPWIRHVSRVICGRYCCECYSSRYYREKTIHIKFVGYSDDLSVCIKAFEFTVYAIKQNIVSRHLNNEDGKDYALGFVVGLDTAYKQQEAEEIKNSANMNGSSEFGLVMTVPGEVTDVMKNIAAETPSTAKKWSNISKYSNGAAFAEGLTDGKNHLTPKLSEVV